MSKVIFVLVEAATTEINEAIKVYSALQKSEKACIWLRYRLHAMHMPRQLVKRGKFNFGIFFGKYSLSNEFQLNRKSQKQTKIVDTSAVCRSIGRRSANWIGLGWIASFDIWAVEFCGYHQNLTHSIFFVSSPVFVSVALVPSTGSSLLRQIIFMGLILWCHLWCFTNIWIGSVIVAHEIDWTWQILPQSFHIDMAKLLLFSNDFTFANDFWPKPVLECYEILLLKRSDCE